MGVTSFSDLVRMLKHKDKKITLEVLYFRKYFRELRLERMERIFGTTTPEAVKFIIDKQRELIAQADLAIVDRLSAARDRAMAESTRWDSIK